ncbi:ankyrin repeat-containing protein ITN1-like [Durio zibethinus]|uniref:Ankyrin repeat-containing protein ITN1-like n=1 Tax=Durio zibethinus TaxID=66656 RepID=A0A6P5WW41_DURZI|nr:ankyrin repeat-containing protein ITN1-like [Durio zibethinus]
MDPKLYEAVITGDFASLQELASSDLTVFLQVTTQEDNILHVAAKYNLKRMAEEIIRLPPLVSLVNQKNSKGDTPLHIAARLGSLGTAQVLINCANTMTQEIEAGERLIRMVNMEQDTALHDAVRNGHDQIAELLIREDPELTLLTNDAEESPLFIAVDKKYIDIAKLILQVAPFCSFQGRNNMNALHAAVIRSQDEVLRLSSYMVKLQSPMNYVTNMSFKHSFQFSSFGPSAIIQAAFRNSIYKDFVACLMEKCQSAALSETDDYGWTPLQYAVHFGAVDIFKMFLRYIDLSTVYIRDKEGMSVTHIAAREGEVVMLEMLAYLFPQIWDLQDNKGQTVLHLAVAGGKLDSVKFILGTDLSHDGLINQQDNEGNTALHLATIQGHHRKIFEMLIKDSRVDKTAINMEGHTVLDILLLKEYGFYEKNWISMSVASYGGLETLEHAINKNGRKTRSIDTRQLEQPQRSERGDPASDTQVEGQQQLAKRKTEVAGLKKPNRDQLQNIASINLLVTTLIATVSFAAGFTMPGGYKSDGPDEGMAILSTKTAFRVFVIANALAFCFSSTSMFLHYCKSFVEKLDVLAFYTYITSLLTSYGITAMVIAFVSGTYAALGDSPGLAKAVLSIGCSFFGLQLLVYLK